MGEIREERDEEKRGRETEKSIGGGEREGERGEERGFFN